jgi:SNF2 family DNA or RNA helicase
MPTFDEATIRKAASWQDFKEAQLLLKSEAVISSESTADGWKGSVRVGKNPFRVTVVARTPTWLDAKCPCPANQRQGTFCPHAIAIGLHLLKPPAPVASKATISPEIRVPEISWKIRFQGPWLKSLEKAQASIQLSASEHTPTPADQRLTAWLMEQKLTSKSTIQLSLPPPLLTPFLSLIHDHPKITHSDGEITVETQSLLHINDAILENDRIVITPSDQSIVRIGETFWQINISTLSQLGDRPPSPAVTQVLKTLSCGIPSSIEKAFFAEYLDELQLFIDLSSSDWFESLQFITAEPQFTLSLSGSENRLLATLSTSYSQSLPKLDSNRLITPNPSAETHAKSLISRTFRPLTDLTFELSQASQITHFLTREIPQFPKNWSIELSPNLQKIAASYTFITPKIEILSASENDIDFQLTYQTQTGEVIPAAEIRRLLRSKNSPSNQRIILADNIDQLIDPLLENLDIQQQNGRFTAKQASAAVIRELCESLGKSTNQKKPADPNPEIPSPRVNAQLRPYQIAGFCWLVQRLKQYGGALLADDMGLGKTLQTIACIEHFFSTYSQPSPVLIVVTTSLLGNWKSEFARFAPDRRVIMLHGSQRDDLKETIQPTDVVLTTYSTLARDLAWHLRQSYSLAVIDEASLIRNPDTDHSKAVAKINATYRIALTGTPVENSARDLWSIFRFIQPGWLGTRKDFQERYETPLQAPETRPQTTTLLRLKTAPFVLRRTKTEVAPDIPSKIVIDEFCTLSRDQLGTYREIQKQGLQLIDQIRASGQTAAARMQSLTTLLRLRQSCCDLALFDSEKLRELPIPRRSAKLERLLEITEASIAAGSRLLVFSQFQKQLIEIETALIDASVSSIRLDGQTRDRQALVDRFQSPDGPSVFLISLKAGGYGLNLTAADVVIHFDPWWNPAAEDQATDRAHRIGQSKPVTVFRLLTRDTVEEKVVRLQSTKKALAESLNETLSPSDAPAWSAAEIEELLKF